MRRPSSFSLSCARASLSLAMSPGVGLTSSRPDCVAPVLQDDCGGNLFPLLLFCDVVSPGGKFSRKCRQRLARRQHSLIDSNHAISALNNLYGGSSAELPPRDTTPRQHAAVADIMERCVQVSKLDHCPSPEEAFVELLGTDPGLYCSEVPMKLASYVLGSVALPGVSSAPHDTRDLVGPECRSFLDDLSGTVLHSYNEWQEVERNSEPIVPYLDPVLKGSPDKYQTFVRQLSHTNIISFT